MSTRSFGYETDLYRVEIKQRNRNGQCVRRDILFTTYSRLYTKPHVDRVRAVDQLCDATNIEDLEEFQILRSPDQQSRYGSSFSFRNRVNEDLWNAYQNALFEAGEW